MKKPAQGAHGLEPRRAAVALIEGVLHDHHALSDLLVAPGGALAGLDPGQRARAQRLATATLRHLERADTLLDPLLRKPPPAPVHIVLRLAVVEHFSEGAAAHGVVNDAVELVRRGRSTKHHAGLTNAVLRRALQDGAERWNTLPPQRLPPWLRKPLVAAWGRAAVAGMEAAHMDGAPLDLTLRDPGAETAQVLAERLGAEPLPTGSLRIPRGAAGQQVSLLPGFAEGAWWVQDAAAALPARLLAPAPGERVLDICAAPGGKTLQLAASGADVTALDISGPRMERLRANLVRTGLAATAVVADALHWQPSERFDAILLDAPCTATGTIRRHPDLPFVKDESDLGTLTRLQSDLLDRALTWLRPGGRIVYCTCSLLPDEGEAQARAIMARNPGVAAETPAFTGLDPAWQSDEGGLRLRPDFWPDRGSIDGFYMIRMRHGG